VPTDFRDLAVLAARWHGLVHRAEELRARTILELLESCDAFRRPERFRELLVACEADHRGRGGGFGDRPYPQAPLLQSAQERAAAVTLTDAERAGLPGEKIGELLRRRRLAALKAA
jgi:tRNA nucleotidyltransferase (CCA-adding enzyme)